MVLEEKKSTLESINGDADIIKQIHVMPQRFYVASKKKNTGLIVIILVGVLLIGGLAAVAVYLNQSLGQARVAAPAVNINAANTNENQNINQNGNMNVDLNANANLNIAVPIATTAPTTTEPIVNENVNTNANTEPIVSPDVGPMAMAYDEDGDKLTALEETLYGTNPKIADSDKDGFADGDELVNGFDPLRANRATLANSGLFAKYSSSLFSIMYPKKWRVKEQSPDKTEILFVAGNGEFVEVLVIDNASKSDLATWYKTEYPTSDFSALTPVTIGAMNGLRSVDSLTYYFLSQNESQVYLINYNVGDSTVLNFGTTFAVMVKNFKMLK